MIYKLFDFSWVGRKKLNTTTIVILEYICQWVLSDNPPESVIMNGKKYYFLNQSAISRAFHGVISQVSVSNHFKKLRDVGVIGDIFFDAGKRRTYISFIWKNLYASLSDFPSNTLNNWKEKIIEIKKLERKSYNREDKKMLIEPPPVKKKYSDYSDRIARKIISKYEYFTHKVPKEGEPPSKTYTKICQKIDDIFLGRFTDTRNYPFDERIFTTIQFNTEGWKEKIKSAKGDWSKVKKLIFSALDNFILMHEPNRVPFDKKYLCHNLSEWFFSDNPLNRGQSQFIQCLNEPKTQGKQLMDKHGDNLIQELKENSPVTYYCGKKLFKLLPEGVSNFKAWKYILEIVDWGIELLDRSNNARYFLYHRIPKEVWEKGGHTGGEVLPYLFANWLEENNISVSLGTINMEKSIENNGPWRWFIEERFRRHDIDFGYMNCFCEDDFDKYDRKKKNRRTYDSEVVL